MSEIRALNVKPCIIPIPDSSTFSEEEVKFMTLRKEAQLQDVVFAVLWCGLVEPNGPSYPQDILIGQFFDSLDIKYDKVLNSSLPDPIKEELLEIESFLDNICSKTKNFLAPVIKYIREKGTIETLDCPKEFGEDSIMLNVCYEDLT